MYVIDDSTSPSLNPLRTCCHTKTNLEFLLNFQFSSCLSSSDISSSLVKFSSASYSLSKTNFSTEYSPFIFIMKAATSLSVFSFHSTKSPVDHLLKTVEDKSHPGYPNEGESAFDSPKNPFKWFHHLLTSYNKQLETGKNYANLQSPISSVWFLGKQSSAVPLGNVLLP